jgi:hypothetical protein
LVREQHLGSFPQWLEEELRAALHRDACGLLQKLFSDPEIFPDEEPARAMEKRYARRPLIVQTLFGMVELHRSYYHHPPSQTGRCPLDERLALVESFSPAVARMMCQAAARSGSYAEAAGDLRRYAAVEIETHAFDRMVERVAPELAQALESLPAAIEAKPIPVCYVSADGTGVPMRREELEGRAGRQPDGSAKTREAKLGCVFTQTVTDTHGEPMRDPDSTSYVGTFAGSAALGILVRQEAMRRGLGRAQQVVFLGDGAAWVWEVARLNFPDAIQILDFYHATEYVGEIASLLFGSDEAKRLRERDRWISRMKETDPSEMLREVRSLMASGGLTPEEIHKIVGKIAYFENQAGRTRYGEFRAKGYFIGSGVIEAGCKCVVGRRLKQSGMFWSETGAENLLGLRCLILGPHDHSAWAARPQIIAHHRNTARRWTAPKLTAAA